MTLRVALVGIKPDGISRNHQNAIRALASDGLVELVAVAEKNRTDKNSHVLDAMADTGVSIYTDYSEMLRSEKLDVVTIATPHHLHVPMAIAALERGVNVFLEKPPAVTVQSGRELIETRQEAGKVVGVNYLFTATQSGLWLRDLIRDGRIGNVTEVIGIGKWMRSNEYYDQTPWRGKRMLGDAALLDGCMFNQFPHLLTECFYFLDGSDNVQSVRAELYRGHPESVTEMEDTVSLLARTQLAKIWMYATTCHRTEDPLEVHVIGDLGSAYWSKTSAGILSPDPTHVEFDESYDSMCTRNYRQFIKAVLGEAELYLTLEEALKTTAAVNAAYVSSGGITQIADKYIDEIEEEGGGESAQIDRDGPQHKRLIKGVDRYIDRCVVDGLLFSEAKVPWARPSEECSVSGLEYFDPMQIG